MEFKAYARFETTLKEFTPRLLAMMSAEDAAIDDVGEAEVADSWECRQRPWLEFARRCRSGKLSGAFVAIAQRDGEKGRHPCAGLCQS